MYLGEKPNFPCTDTLAIPPSYGSDLSRGRRQVYGFGRSAWRRAREHVVLLFAFSAGDSKEIYTSNAAERLNTSLGPRRASIDIRRLGRRIANHMKAMRCTSPPKYLYILCHRFILY
jgi:hypothetical protein